jgi:hypothetical protein
MEEAVTPTNEGIETTEQDGLKISYNDETGEMTLEWDSNDERWSGLNGMTGDDFKQMMLDYCKQILENEDGTV